MLLAREIFLVKFPSGGPGQKNAKAAGLLLPGFPCARVFVDEFIDLPFAGWS